MADPCNLCDGNKCCSGKDSYCLESECCDPFICLCGGLEVKEEISTE